MGCRQQMQSLIQMLLVWNDTKIKQATCAMATKVPKTYYRQNRKDIDIDIQFRHTVQSENNTLHQINKILRQFLNMLYATLIVFNCVIVTLHRNDVAGNIQLVVSKFHYVQSAALCIVSRWLIIQTYTTTSTSYS